MYKRQLGDLGGYHLAHGLSVVTGYLAGQQSFDVSGIAHDDGLGDVLYHLLEVGGVGNEVGLAVDLDHRAHAALLADVGAYNALSGEVILQRFWEPAWTLAWLLFEGMFLWFYPADGSLGAAVGLSAILLILLIAGAFGWSVMYRRENGTFKWMFIILPLSLIHI